MINYVKLDAFHENEDRIPICGGYGIDNGTS